MSSEKSLKCHHCDLAIHWTMRHVMLDCGHALHVICAALQRAESEVKCRVCHAIWGVDELMQMEGILSDLRRVTSHSTVCEGCHLKQDYAALTTDVLRIDCGHYMHSICAILHVRHSSPHCPTCKLPLSVKTFADILKIENREAFSNCFLCEHIITSKDDVKSLCGGAKQLHSRCALHILNELQTM